MYFGVHNRKTSQSVYGIPLNATFLGLPISLKLENKEENKLKKPVDFLMEFHAGIVCEDVFLFLFQRKINKQTNWFRCVYHNMMLHYQRLNTASEPL